MAGYNVAHANFVFSLAVKNFANRSICHEVIGMSSVLFLF